MVEFYMKLSHKKETSAKNITLCEASSALLCEAITLEKAASFYEKSVSHEASSLSEAASLCVTASLMFDGLTLKVQNSFLMSSFCEAVSLL